MNVELNKIDVVFMGIGENGHIAFNEPFTSLSSPTGVRALTQDTLIVNSSELFEMPSLYGGGIMYTYDDRLMIGADFIYQEYSKALYYGKRDTLANRMKISLGAEYTHDPRGRRYIDRMAWRIGANYNNSYTKINEYQASNFSITCGVGLPLRTSKTIINVNFEYGNIGGMKAILKENYFKFGLNFSLNEMWFVKAKVR